MTSPTMLPDRLHWLVGGGEMGECIRSFDWSKTPLGADESWSPALRMMVRFLLANRFPMLLWWGPQYISLYNDPYCPVLGTKHPAALGQAVSECWSEIWHILKPLIDTPFYGGSATWDEDIQLEINRHGFVEETHFTVAYSPVPDETVASGIGGVLATVHETTEKVIGQRRVMALRDLGARAGEAKSVDEACGIAARTLAMYSKDVPFAQVYLLDGDGTWARLAGSTGGAADDCDCRQLIDLGKNAHERWPLDEVVRTQKMQLVGDLDTRLGSPVPMGPWSDPPRQAVIVPIRSAIAQRLVGVLVAGVSARLDFDELYGSFFELIASQIATAIANAQAYEAERKRADALAEIDRAKTAFFSNVSHELRTPLTLILGPLQDALAQSDASLPREHVEMLHRNARRLQKLVNSLLDFSRIEAGRIQANYEPTDLSRLTIDLASVFRSAVEKAGLRLVVDCPPLEEAVYVDRDMYEKIVLNLLSNAFKFTFAGEIEVRLRDAGAMIEVSVRDTGSGIAGPHLPHLFERFHRIEGARGRTQEGTGIGLALVQELARLHGGSVSVQSVLQRGSVFTVTLPKGSSHLPADRLSAAREPPSPSISDDYFLQEALRWLPSGATSGEEPDAAVASALNSSAPVARARIVWADDNADMRSYVARLLDSRYDVEAVPDGEAALAAVHRQVPDLLLSDVMMPGLDGFGLLRALRDDERTCDIPVILLSARAGEEAHVEGMQAGADDYLIKPFSARELLARIDAHITIARQRREHELRYRTLFDSIDEGYCIARVLFDDSGKACDYVFDEVNESFARQTGIYDAQGRSMRDIEPNHDQHWFDIYGRIALTGQAERFVSEASALRRWFDVYAFRIGPPEDRRVAILFKDITEHKLAEEALREADRRKDEFLATLAHELRNPLAPIRNGLHILRMTAAASAADAGSTMRIHELLEEQVNHMVRLVDDLMEVSRITGGKIELRKERVDLATVLQSAIEISAPLIDAAHHRLTVSLPSELLVVDADAMRLAQVIANLLNNSAKYTKNGGGIWLTAWREDDNAVISVRDNGMGIPSAVLPKVFDLFAQAERTYDRARGGLGIGLTLVRSLVELHGGRVEAMSEGAGKGSEFLVRLPLAEQLAPARHENPVSQKSVVASHRILVVDDNRDAGDTIGMILEMLGAEVHIVRDGPSALAALNSYRPQTVLLDIGLPGMDGYEVARRARQLPRGRDLTLVAVTGWGQAEDRRRSKEAGMDHHLVKPVDIAALEKLLATVAAKNGDGRAGIEA